jgi:hypothetical protein
MYSTVQLRTVGGQILQRDLAALRFDVVSEQSRAMRLQTIPDNQELAAERGLQCLEELDDLWALDRGRGRSGSKSTRS